MKFKPVVEARFERDGDVVFDVPTVEGTTEFSLTDELRWGGTPDTNEALESHSPKEAWWSARLADEIAICAQWTETVYEPFMCHLRRFAVYALRGQGTRRKDATTRDVNDMVFCLYSETKTPDHRERFVRFAFLGCLFEQYDDNKAAVDRLYKESPEVYQQKYDAFLQEIFAYQQAEPVWVEEAIRRRISLERSKDLLNAAAQAFRDRGFLLKQSAENEKARRLAIDGVDIRGLAEQVANILRGKK